MIKVAVVCVFSIVDPLAVFYEHVFVESEPFFSMKIC